MKIKTTRYNHKVIDVVNFQYGDKPTNETIYDLFNDLAENLIDSIQTGRAGGRVKIHIDRPLSKADTEHRMGVVAKNTERRNRYSRWYTQRQRETDRATYERLRKQFEGES